MEELPTEQNKFLNTLSDLSKTHGVIWQNTHILVALSGGLDSVCMVRLLSHCQNLLGYNLKVIHFNHGLRGAESDSDRDFCLELCSCLGLQVDLVDLQMSKKSSNLQATAREKRKQYYAHWKCLGPDYLVATAHHKDDFIESFFIGVHQGRLDERLIPLEIIDLDTQYLRPLVIYNKAELLDLAIKNEWEWCEDSSNSKTNYLRNFYRKELLMDIDLVESVSNFTDCLANLDFELRNWMNIQLKKFDENGFILDRYECKFWENSRFRDFWLAILQRDYPKFLKSFDAKRLQQIRIDKYRGNRRFQIGLGQVGSMGKLILVETLRGYHLEIE